MCSIFFLLVIISRSVIPAYTPIYPRPTENKNNTPQKQRPWRQAISTVLPKCCFDNHQHEARFLALSLFLSFLVHTHSCSKTFWTLLSQLLATTIVTRPLLYGRTYTWQAPHRPSCAELALDSVPPSMHTLPLSLSLFLYSCKNNWNTPLTNKKSYWMFLITSFFRFFKR